MANRATAPEAVPDGLRPSLVVTETDGPDVTPEFFAGSDNRTCSELAGPGQTWIELKVDPNADGTYTSADGRLTVTISNTTDDKSFDWESNIGVDAVYVKAGSGGSYLYRYDPPAEQRQDDGLSSPGDTGNGISHISFCYDLNPHVSVEKTGDALSKIGDPANYTFTVTNDGDFPLTRTSIIDDVLGDITDDVGLNAAIANYVSSCGASLAVGASCTITLTYTIPAGSPDPLVNTVTVTYTPAAGSAVTDSDDHSTNLFQPAVQIVKTGPANATIGSTVTYSFTITNQSSADAPNLVLQSVNDDKIGDITAAAAAAVPSCSTLASSASCTFTANYLIPAGATSPLANVVEAYYKPYGFPNEIRDTDDHSLTLLSPNYTILKECTTEPITLGSPAGFKITVTNTGDVSLNINVVDPDVVPALNANIVLAPGASQVYHVTKAVGAGVTYVSNTVNATATVTGLPGFSLAKSSSARCNLPAGDGCTPGYWKNHPERWDGVNTGGARKVDVTTTVQKYDLFNASFGVTSSQSGLSNSVTLIKALSVSGGELMALNRHAAAALANADASGVDYFYTTAQVIALYQDAVGAIAGPETIASAHAKLAMANERLCRLN